MVILSQVENLIYIMALDFFFLPLNLFLLSSLISFTYLPFRQKILKSTEKRIKMREVVEVLETNAKSKKCNPVEAGLYKFKVRKLDPGVLYSGCIFP